MLLNFKRTWRTFVFHLSNQTIVWGIPLARTESLLAFWAVSRYIRVFLWRSLTNTGHYEGLIAGLTLTLALSPLINIDLPPCNVSWLLFISIKNLHLMQKAAATILNQIRRFDHTLSSLHWLPIWARSDFKYCSFSTHINSTQAHTIILIWSHHPLCTFSRLPITGCWLADCHQQ